MLARTPEVIPFGSVASNTRRGGDLRVLLSPGTVNATAGFSGIVRLNSGEFVTEHYHPYSDEFLVVTRGTVLLAVNDYPIEVSEDEAVMVTRGTRHRLTNNGEQSAQVVFFLAPLAPRPELGHVDTQQVRGGS